MEAAARTNLDRGAARLVQRPTNFTYQQRVDAFAVGARTLDAFIHQLGRGIKAHSCQLQSAFMKSAKDFHGSTSTVILKIHQRPYLLLRTRLRNGQRLAYRVAFISSNQRVRHSAYWFSTKAVGLRRRGSSGSPSDRGCIAVIFLHLRDIKTSSEEQHWLPRSCVHSRSHIG